MILNRNLENRYWLNGIFMELELIRRIMNGGIF
jgi:hypothetical protein